MHVPRFIRHPVDTCYLYMPTDIVVSHFFMNLFSMFCTSDINAV